MGYFELHTNSNATADKYSITTKATSPAKINFCMFIFRDMQSSNLTNAVVIM